MTDEMPLTGSLEPPMANGEVLFEEPWQGRVFGMARLLCEQGRYEWDEFREALIQRVASWEASDRENEPYAYFDHFLGAFEDVLGDRELMNTDELAARQSEFAARPHGHDH